jgi:hypothetical protein
MVSIADITHGGNLHSADLFSYVFRRYLNTGNVSPNAVIGWVFF